MNLIIAGHTNSYHTYTFEEALRGIARAGFTYAELTAVPDWADFVKPTDDPARIRGVLEDAGLDCVAMSMHLEPGDEQSVAAARELVDWAGRFGLQHLNCALGEAPEGSNEWHTNVAELVRRADAAGVSFNIEVHGPLARTGAEVAAVLDQLGETAGGINYDTGNVEFYGGVAMTDDLPGVVDRVRHFHLKDKLGGTKDWAFPALGGGHVDFATLGQLLGERGATPAMSVELEFHGEPWPPLAVVDDAMAVSRNHLAAVGLL
ncbi:sugar phosphate isomerase/epimerase [Georgenia satyanarayanai]|uniref:sugar phosphate isomerase/epimerase family protein n=1 Tax=Georgenia satyanarayanai TaxID=860221 RepID=UPI00203C0C28|nr:sugar phosphate isomerase/epimerase [Georgenia satyanarayanai]MCM3661396.1 sugar phosphate isomerase/epimerase [Georgenia satyanarayanai]